MKLQELPKGIHMVSLPVQIVRAKGWEKGNDIQVTINKEGNLVLKKK